MGLGIAEVDLKGSYGEGSRVEQLASRAKENAAHVIDALKGLAQGAVKAEFEGIADLVKSTAPLFETTAGAVNLSFKRCQSFLADSLSSSAPYSRPTNWPFLSSRASSQG